MKAVSPELEPVDKSQRIVQLEFELLVAQAEAQKGAVAKARFLANVSHELRTPLNAILGFSKILCRDTDRTIDIAKYREYVGIIYESGDRLSGLLNNILEMARIEGGQVEIRDAHLEVADLVRSAIQLLSAEADKAQVRIDLELDNAPVLIADERAMRRVLVNIIHNAIKFNRSNGHVRITARTDPSGKISITIADTGVGMEEEKIPLLTEPFTQASDDLARRYEGGGLGLGVVKGLVTLHDAELTVASKPNVGTTVTITFPVYRTKRSAVDLDATLIQMPHCNPMPFGDVLSLEHNGQRVWVYPASGKCVLGRNREKPEKVICDIVVDDPHVSRPHAFVRYEEDGYYLFDESQCGSYVVKADGTIIYSCRDKPVRLQDNGTIYLGLPPEDTGSKPIDFHISASAQMASKGG